MLCCITCYFYSSKISLNLTILSYFLSCAVIFQVKYLWKSEELDAWYQCTSESDNWLCYS